MGMKNVQEWLKKWSVRNQKIKEKANENIGIFR
jgi:hypothetical protein